VIDSLICAAVITAELFVTRQLLLNY